MLKVEEKLCLTPDRRIRAIVFYAPLNDDLATCSKVDGIDILDKIAVLFIGPDRTDGVADLLIGSVQKQTAKARIALDIDADIIIREDAVANHHIEEGLLRAGQQRTGSSDANRHKASQRFDASRNMLITGR